MLVGRFCAFAVACKMFSILEYSAWMSFLWHYSFLLFFFFGLYQFDMGIYLSTPKTEKYSEDGENNRLRFGMSSMQGWRSTMEDAVSSRLFFLFLFYLHVLMPLYHMNFMFARVLHIIDVIVSMNTWKFD